MAPLFFWRKKSSKTPSPPPADAAPARASAPAAPLAAQPVPASAAPLPVQRLVYALALDSPRAADPAATPDANQGRLVLSASQTVALVGSEARYTPQRPSLLPQLMEAVNDEEASLRALSRIVIHDPQLTGEMLRTANSALYRVSSTPVESIERAAALLGTRGIRMLISGVLMKPLAQAGGRPDRFGDITWEHSTYSAAAADAWAARSQEADPFTAQMLALLHGLGVFTVYRVFMDLYTAHPSLPRDPAAIATALEGSSAAAAARIAQSWGLSERSQQALEALSTGNPGADSTALVRALEFGLHAGALTLLCRRGKLTEDQAQEQIAAGGFQGPVAVRVWERLMQAYVRP